MLSSHLTVDSVQRQVAVRSRELHQVQSNGLPCRSVALPFFLHQVEGLGRTWTTYRDSLLSTIHSCSLVHPDRFEPGSALLQDFLFMIQEVHIHALQAHRVVIWLLSLREQLLARSSQ